MGTFELPAEPTTDRVWLRYTATDRVVEFTRSAGGGGWKPADGMVLLSWSELLGRGTVSDEDPRTAGIGWPWELAAGVIRDADGYTVARGGNAESMAAILAAMTAWVERDDKPAPALPASVAAVLDAVGEWVGSWDDGDVPELAESQALLDAWCAHDAEQRAAAPAPASGGEVAAWFVQLANTAGDNQ